jgi:hypothetical protein
LKGCARSCLIGLVGCLVSIAAFVLLFVRLGADPNTLAVPAVGAGLLATLSISSAWSGFDRLRDRRRIRDAIAGQTPVDGKWAGFSGVIRSASPLTSPISGKSAVAFKYSISRRVGSGKSAHTVSYYEGAALASPRVSTNVGTFKLLAVPLFDMAKTEVERNEAVRNAEAYIAATTFETKETPKEERQTAEKEWTDDDGFFRRDRHGADHADLALCHLDEQMIAQGAQVCVLGLYSQGKGGIVPDPNWANQTRVILGDGEAGLVRLSTSARRYFIAAFVFAALAAGIAWAYVVFKPQ